MPDTFQRWGSVSFIVDRPLSDREKIDQLHQSEPSLSKPWCFLSVIRMNSTYLECVDKYFLKRGGVAGVGILGLICFGCLFVVINIHGYHMSQIPGRDYFFNWICNNLIISIPSLMVFWAFHFECFRFTHYPIRFNRKTRMVHVFRRNGTVMSEHWDRLFFTPSYRQDWNWEVRGHRMDEDGVTVRETFVLPLWGLRDDDGPNPSIYALWEFIRRYMEEGPEKLVEQVEITMDVHDKRETFMDGVVCLIASFKESAAFIIPLLPIILLASIGRLIAMRTSKIPVWPQRIEKECEFSRNDPCIRDEYHLAPPNSAIAPQWGHPEPQSSASTVKHYYSED